VFLFIEKERYAMSEFVQKIYRDCPMIFRHVKEGSRGSANYVILVNAGWYQLVYDMCIEIELVAQMRKAAGDSDEKLPKIKQVKQKLCQFRCAVDGESGFDEINEITERFTLIATKICELCGVYGTKPMEFDGYFVLICERCAHNETKRG
jgi:hypothetical protein